MTPTPPEARRTLNEIVKAIEGHTRCNCDLDNWQPEADTGHSCVCRIHKAAKEEELRQPTAPTQPPAPLAGGTAQQPSTAPAEVAAGCKEGRSVSPANDWAMQAAKQLNVPGAPDEHVAAVIRHHAESEAGAPPIIPATGEREAELHNAILCAVEASKLSGCEDVKVIRNVERALTPLLDRREAELSQQWRLSSVCREKQLDIDALHQQLHITEEQVAALRTLVAKQREDLRESEAARGEAEKLKDAIRWALGEHETDGFRERSVNEGAYWWRKELRQRAARAQEAKP